MACARLGGRRAILMGSAALLVLLPAARSSAQEDLAFAQALVPKLQSEVSSRPAVARAVASALANASLAIERSRRMRAVGDEVHARAADGLAREWAETARDLAQAVDAETRAAELRRKAVESQAQLERARALVEEGIAHVGRLRAELEKSQVEGKTTRTAVEKHDGSPDAAQKPKAPAKPNANGDVENAGKP